MDEEQLKIRRFEDLPDETFEKCDQALEKMREVRNIFECSPSHICLFTSILCNELALIAEIFCEEGDYDKICDSFRDSIRKNIDLGKIVKEDSM